MFKRKREDSPPQSDDEASSSSCHTDGSTEVSVSTSSKGYKKQRCEKKNVNFNGVKVFYFPRKQGFTCVPSQGGSTLGMSVSHTHIEEFSLKEYACEQRRIRRQILVEQGHINAKPAALRPPPSESPFSSSDSSDCESDPELDELYYLQPVSTRQRRLLLRLSGVKKIDNEEKDECKEIRGSREFCGCNCQIYCDPATCACSLEGIQCQVDRMSFPCGCTKDGCRNVAGRIEFNPVRVRTHFIHTLMRLELEKQEETGHHLSGRNTSLSHIRFNEDCEEDKDGEKFDITHYNSNEKGSCRDCQNSALNAVQMHDVRMSNYDNGLGSDFSGMSYEEVESEGLPMQSITNTIPKVALFNDSEDESHAIIHNENTTSFYQCKPDEASYSESSNGSSSDGSVTYDEPEIRHFQDLASMAPIIPQTTSTDTKFTELAPSPAFYKLEPISEIINPSLWSDSHSYGTYSNHVLNGSDKVRHANFGAVNHDDCSSSSEHATFGPSSVCSDFETFQTWDNQASNESATAVEAICKHAATNVATVSQKSVTSYQGDQKSLTADQEKSSASIESPVDDTRKVPENPVGLVLTEARNCPSFGEIIKESIVETVSA